MYFPAHTPLTLTFTHDMHAHPHGQTDTCPFPLHAVPTDSDKQTLHYNIFPRELKGQNRLLQTVQPESLTPRHSNVSALDGSTTVITKRATSECPGQPLCRISANCIFLQEIESQKLFSADSPLPGTQNDPALEGSKTAGSQCPGKHRKIWKCFFCKIASPDTPAAKQRPAKSWTTSVVFVRMQGMEVGFCFGLSF